MGFLKNLRKKVRGWLEPGKKESSMESRESENRVIRHRYRQAAERLMENSSLRDELNDEKAKELLDWGTAYLKKIAGETADLPEEEANNILEAQTERVSGVLRQVNQLAGAIHNKDQLQLSRHLTALAKNLDEIKETGGELPKNIKDWLSLLEKNNDPTKNQRAIQFDSEEE